MNENEITEEKPPSPPHLDELQFCPSCFASNENGSWNHVVVDNLCSNCGSIGTVKLPRWAVESIRRSASWVGKRYYPSEEDLLNSRELRYLRHISAAPVQVEECSRIPGDGDGPRPWLARRGDTTVMPYATREAAFVEGNKALRFPVPDDFEPIKKR